MLLSDDDAFKECQAICGPNQTNTVRGGQRATRRPNKHAVITLKKGLNKPGGRRLSQIAVYSRQLSQLEQIIVHFGVY